MKKSIIGLLWGESTLKVMAILYDSVITAFLLQFGLKNTQIGLLWSVVLLTQMLFDYPTGSFADRYGRLKIFTIGMVLTGSAIVMIAYSVNISMLYISAILMGIGESQISGTLFPWFVNSLDKVENLQEKEEYILKSPVRRIHKVKTGTVVKETYSDEAMEIMRDNCKSLRDLAIIDMLASTGMRVGELVKLNIEDIDFEGRECVVFGKGDKERKVYFDARTKIHLHNYLKTRDDDNSALFVSLLKPHKRLQISGVEIMLRQLGRKLNITKVHPHKFRRTLATKAIDKGMPIEQVQQLLGHQKIDTTLQYAMVSQNNVKISHRKYIG